MLGAVMVVLWFRGPDWELVGDAFRLVEWSWILAAIGLNLVSVLVRAYAWQTVVEQALPDQRPPFHQTFSAFAIGLLANAVLPGRIGELARVAVLTRHMERGTGAAPTLLGTVFAHRVFDLIPALLLTAYVLTTANVPHWAITSLVIVAGIGVVFFVFALVGGRWRSRAPIEDLGAVRRLLAMARRGLGVMRAPLRLALAITLQTLGWVFQLLAVYVAMRAFDIDEPLPAAALVLLLMNVATIFPLWPGNFGLLQAAVAIPLVSYGVPYARGFAFGIGLQALEMSVGVGVGLIFLAREGLSIATLRSIERETEEEFEHELEETPEPEREPVGAASTR
jgi:uncharacterized protein (TIRG00374 family)